MANKLDRDQIEALKAEGLSVRKIAERLSESSGAKVSPSSVHYMLSKEYGNGEGKTSSEVPESVLLGRLDSIEVSVRQLQAAVDKLSGDSSNRESQIFRRTFLICLALAYLCVVIGGKITDSILVRWLCYAWALFTLWELSARARHMMAKQLWKKN
jgi:hypothetical protein